MHVFDESAREKIARAAARMKAEYEAQASRIMQIVADAKKHSESAQ